ncbi:zinc finger MYM-type protein 1-like [Melanaphis sacchari]|uniref:zinc finger MYM-type protein 1-like n=1 Tax=Melanaphis sacchari TaxID=742174 RepID=UPI000DC13E3A|nr:zinc finger MYM-type protein 1-like [Melanaphis sacchari]
MYPMAHFFHCASHRLNLVINDLNTVTEVRNCIGKIKETITFFRDSALRKNIIGGSVLTKLCKIRIVEKHKSVRQFNERFVTIVESLEEIFKSNNFNKKFEIISTVLQGIDVDLQQATRHVQDLLSMLQKDRGDCETQFSSIFEKAVEIASKINLELTLPPRNARQTHRENYPTNNRFSDEKLKIFALFDLHPKKIKYMNRQTFMKTLKVICQVYGSILENFEEQALSWYELWQDKPLENDMKLIDILDYETFYPVVCIAIRISITLPATSCSVERSFSTLRRLKTWLRNKIGNERLSSLGLINIHRQRYENKEFFDQQLEAIIQKFGLSSRRLELLFND